VDAVKTISGTDKAKFNKVNAIKAINRGKLERRRYILCNDSLAESLRIKYRIPIRRHFLCSSRKNYFFISM